MSLINLAHARRCRHYAIRAREMAETYQAKGNTRMARLLFAISDSFARQARGGREAA